jgi:hypothetical protein
MKSTLKAVTLSLSLLAGSLLSTASFAQEAENAQVAKEVQWLLRNSYSLHHHALGGNLRTEDGLKIPFELTLQENMVRFKFQNPIQIVHLDIEEGGAELREVVTGSNQPVPAERYAELIRGTDICYEDLAMRFLHWPNPELLGEESIKTRATWKLRIYNPGKLGPYHAVEVWVDKDSGGMLQLRAYNFDGKMVKEFKVVSGQKIDGAWVLKQMRIESFEPGETIPYTRTYLEIDRQ